MVFRLHGDELVFGGAVHPVQPQIPQMKMMKVHIPFTFKLQDSCRSSHSGESCDLRALILVHPSHYFHKFTFFLVNQLSVRYRVFSLKRETLGFCCGRVEGFTPVMLCSITSRKIEGLPLKCFYLCSVILRFCSVNARMFLMCGYLVQEQL